MRRVEEGMAGAGAVSPVVPAWNDVLVASDELRILRAPFETYRRLAAGPQVGWPTALRRPLFTLLLLGAFVSLTSAGRFAIAHLGFAFVSWWFVPLFQSAWVLLLHRIAGGARSRSSAIDLFFAGQGPWLLWLLAISGITVLAPDAAEGLRSSAAFAALALSIFLTLGWGMVNTFAFIRALCGERPLLTVGLFALYYLGMTASFVAYFLLSGQLLPIVGSSG